MNKLHEVQRHLYKWGTFGKNPDMSNNAALMKAFQVVPISQLSTYHIYAILRMDQRRHLLHYLRLFKNELKYRALNGLYIPETDRYKI